MAKIYTLVKNMSMLRKCPLLMTECITIPTFPIRGSKNMEQLAIIQPRGFGKAEICYFGPRVV